MATSIALSPLHAEGVGEGRGEGREDERATIDLRSGTLAGALAELSREHSVSIGAEGRLPNLRTPRVRGRMTVGQALEQLLRGSDFVARRVGERAWRIERRQARPTGPAPVPSPEAPPPTTVSETPIVVTASKRSRALSSLPMDLAVVGFDEDRPGTASDGSASVAEASEGLSLSGLGPGRNRMFLRGVADSAFSNEGQSPVAIVLDEARVTYAAPDPDLRLVDVEQVELIMGPQGALYGTGSIGGIYRVVTRKPDPSEASLELSTSGQAVVDGDVGYEVSLSGNLPIVTDAAALRLVGYAGREAGWIETGDRRNSNASTVLGARATLGVEIADRWHGELAGVYQELESQDSRYVYAPRSREREAQLAEPHDNDFSHVAMRLSGALGDVKLQANSGMTWHSVDDTLDATIGAAQFGLPDPTSLNDHRSFRVWDSELRASGDVGRLNWLLGIAHLEARQSLQLTLFDAGGAALILDDDRRTSADSAVFGDVSLALSDQLSVDIGGRLFTSTTAETRNTDIGLVTRDIHKQGLTPALAVAWQPRAERLLFLRYGSAFRQGGADISETGVIEPLDSDEIATLEAGWREHLGNGGNLELNSFFSWWSRIQSDVLQPDGLIESANVGDGEIAGVEATLDIPLADGLHLAAGGSFVRARLVNDTLGLDGDDLRLPVVPEYVVRAALTKDFAIAGSPAEVGIRLRYLGPSRLSFDPAVDQPMGNVLETGLHVRARVSGFDVEAQLENLLDQRSNTFAFGNPLRFASTRQFTPQSPMRVIVSVRRKF